MRAVEVAKMVKSVPALLLGLASVAGLTVLGVVTGQGSWVLALPLLAAGIGVYLLTRRDAIGQRGATTTGYDRLTVLAVVVLLIGTLTWRGRTAADLSNSPVDAAAALRLAADLVALALAIWSMTRRHPRLHGPMWKWYAAYICVVLLGAVVAVDSGLVLFRVVDLFVALVVCVEAVRANALGSLIRLSRQVLLGLAAIVLVEAAALPSLAFSPARGGIVPFRLSGIFPIVTDNTVGIVGVLLVGLALADRHWRLTEGVVGVLLVLLSQYRTGYLAVAALVALSLLARRGPKSKAALVFAIPVAWWIASTSIAQDAWVRGEAASNSVATLSGRTQFWSVAIDVARRSPIIGTGLTSGTRFEALDQLGDNSTSTIHGTWVEIYLGTGVLGLLVMSGFVIVSVYAAWRVRHISQVPLLIVGAILVRSITGSTIELVQITLVLFLLVALKANELSVDMKRSVPAGGAQLPAGSSAAGA